MKRTNHLLHTFSKEERLKNKIKKKQQQQKNMGFWRPWVRACARALRSVCSSAFLYSGGRKRLADATVQTEMREKGELPA